MDPDEPVTIVEDAPGRAPRPTGYRALLIGTVAAAIAVGLLLLSSPDPVSELVLIFAGAAQVAPFVILAMAAYLAEDSRPLRYLTGVLLLGIVGSLVLISLAFGVLAVVPAGADRGGDAAPGDRADRARPPRARVALRPRLVRRASPGRSVSGSHASCR